jgi:hypothetical protein
MTFSTLRIILSLFLIAHGLIHMSLATVPIPKPGAVRTPFWPAWWREATDPAWPASRLGLNPEWVRTTDWILWLVITVVYALAGLGLLGVPGLSSIWQPLAVTASIVSLFLLVFYWHPWLVMGLLLDLGLILGAYGGWLTRWFAVVK